MSEEKRISSSFAIVMVVFAGVVDLVQFFLDIIVIGVILNRIIDVFVLILFWMLFKSQGISFTKTRAFVFFGFALLEMFPGLDAFPLWTADVLAVMAMTAAEDRIPALKKLDQSGLAGKNPAKLKAMMSPGEINAMRRASGAIMNTLQPTKGMPSSVMSRSDARARQKYDAELDRQKAQIAAQRERKNANQEKNQLPA